MNPGNLGIVGKPAPELDATWLAGVEGDSPRFVDIDEPFIYLYPGYCSLIHERRVGHRFGWV